MTYIRSASELRAAWPEMGDEDKLQAADLMYPGKGEEASKMLDTALGTKDAVAAEDVSPEDEDKFHTDATSTTSTYSYSICSIMPVIL